MSTILFKLISNLRIFIILKVNLIAKDFFASNFILVLNNKLIIVKRIF